MGEVSSSPPSDTFGISPGQSVLAPGVSEGGLSAEAASQGCDLGLCPRDHDLTDPVLERLAAIVHQADVEDDEFDVPEAAGLDAIVRGLTLVHEDDEVVRHVTNEIFDGLYRYLSRESIGRA